MNPSDRVAELERRLEEAERALAEAQSSRFRKLVESSPDVLGIVGPDLELEYMSPEITRLTGYTVEELRSRPRLEWVHPEDVPSVQVALREVLASGPERSVRVTLRRRRKSGGWVHTELIGRNFVQDPDIRGVLVSARDVSERVQFEAALDEAKEAAVAASLTKSAFLANMSHELRTPLNGVIGMVDLLASTKLDERQRRYAQVARASASLLLSVINDILDFAKIEAGKVELEQAEFAPADLLEEVTSIFTVSAEEKGVELCCETAGLHEPLLGAPSRLRQVLVNLLANAIKFTPKGEVVLRASARPQASGVELRVEVSDTGIGIPATAQRRLFQPFSQLDASTARGQSGAGLGLAIARELVQRMGGEIGVTSTPGEGSTFWFTVRLARPDRPEGAAPKADGRLAGARVLGVDDNATHRELVRTHLAAAGMVCDTAADGASALAILVEAAERGRPYDLAVLDHHMPGMDGCELARSVRADPRLRATRLVMLGSMVKPLDPAEQRALGILRYGTKPVWRTQLLRIVSAALADISPEPPDLVATVARTPGPGVIAPLILLVEDSPINAEVAGEILLRSGYAFDLVTDGVRAVLAAQRRPYDLILMDCQLPELDGCDATRRIRTLESAGHLPGPRRRIPILALTASTTEWDLERCLAAGMDDQIPKPIDARRLLHSIASWLAQAASSTQHAANRRDGPLVANLDNALERLQGNQALLGRIIEQFKQAARDAKVDLHSRVALRDGPATAFTAHRLRGQAAAFDAHALIGSVEALEDAAKRDDWPVATATLTLVEGEIDRLLAAFAALP